MSDEKEALVPEVVGNPERSPRHHVRHAEKALVVYRMAGLGLTKGACAKCIGVSLSVFNREYLEDYDTGTIDMQQELAKLAFDIAKEGNVPMLLHLVKTKLGWNEKQTVEHVGEVRSIVSNRPLTKEEFEARYLSENKEEDTEA
jgi:hypothetical protein